MFIILIPHSFIFTTVGVKKYTIAVPKSITPLSYIPIPQVLLLSLRFVPNVNSHSVLEVVCPLARVFLAGVVVYISVFNVILLIIYDIIEVTSSDLKIYLIVHVLVFRIKNVFLDIPPHLNILILIPIHIQSPPISYNNLEAIL
jgi:hypothetical protein